MCWFNSSSISGAKVDGARSSTGHACFTKNPTSLPSLIHSFQLSRHCKRKNLAATSSLQQLHPWHLLVALNLSKAVRIRGSLPWYWLVGSTHRYGSFTKPVTCNALQENQNLDGERSKRSWRLQWSISVGIIDDCVLHLLRSSQPVKRLPSVPKLGLTPALPINNKHPPQTRSTSLGSSTASIMVHAALNDMQEQIHWRSW